jgi:hypothetical protein
MKPQFEYKDCNTTDDLKYVTVADIRDLVNAAFLSNATDKKNEINYLIHNIANKHGLDMTLNESNV